MQSTQEYPTVQTVYAQLQAWSPLVRDIVDAIHHADGTVLAIGGAVRDAFLKKPIKDLDCEVYGISLSQLETILKQFGHVRFVGKSFGVLRIDTVDVDWSLPRTDAEGRKPRVMLNSFLAFKEAALRRDLTMNAIGINMTTGELIDPCNGLDDLQSGALRAPDLKQFSADPLRLYRVMQFVSRFAMKVDEQLSAVCARMDVSTVSRERIEQEWHKMLMQSERPSLGIRWLSTIGRLQDLFPEIAALHNVPQRADYHPEGDVFEHTMQALDAAVRYRELCGSDGEKKQLMYAVLCHDMGKPMTTVWDQNRWRSPGHAEAGVDVARSFLRRITRESQLIKTVCILVKYHMRPGEYASNNASDWAYKKLAAALHPCTTLRMLSMVYGADRGGRNGDGSSLPLPETDPAVTKFINHMQKLGILDNPEPPVLTGQDLVDIIAPGPMMGLLLRRAYDHQIKHNITDKEQLKEYIKQKRHN